MSDVKKENVAGPWGPGQNTQIRIQECPNEPDRTSNYSVEFNASVITNGIWLTRKGLITLRDLINESLPPELNQAARIKELEERVEELGFDIQNINDR